ncbi:MAG: hypothetical protein RLY20_1717 [Verrucomicrobiota bacterium]|jgi:hypothetical protein
MNGRMDQQRIAGSRSPAAHRQLQVLSAVCRVAAMGALFASAWPMSAQTALRPYQEPHWATLNIDRVYTGVYAEAYTQTTSISGGGESTEDRLFFGPLLGLDLSGSVYHPNLIAYHINVDGSVGWTEDNYSGAATASTRELRFLGSFFGEIGILDSKPLHGRLFSSYTHSYQDYDFFNRIYVDTWRYGGSLNYSTGPWRFFTSVSHETQDATGNPIPIWSDSTIASASLTHQRKSGSSTIFGSVNDYTRTDYGVAGAGRDYTLNLSDSEDFGPRKNWHSVVNAGYNHLESMTLPSQLYSAAANLRAEHSEQLSSQYNLNYSQNTYGESDNDNISGNLLLEHKLFQSLVTDLNLQGYRYTASSSTDSQRSWQFGGGPGVRYTKRLSRTSVLSAYENIGYFHTDVQSSGGLIPVIDEQHVFGSSGQPITLRQPNIIQSTIVVTDNSHLPPGGYIAGLDYNIIQNGQFTLIERPVGSRVPDSVLISYNFEASPSGSYDTVNNACGLRFDFFDNHWSVYTRYSLTHNDGAENLVVQDLNLFVLGTEGHWKALRAGVEFEIYDSSLAPYDSLRFFQSLTFAPAQRSRLGFNFTETLMNYEQANRADQNYTATVNYNQAFTRHLNFDVETGVSQRIGEGVDQTLAVFRPQVQYSSGKFSASIGYDLNYDEYLSSQTRIRNLAYIRLRKDF